MTAEPTATLQEPDQITTGAAAAGAVSAESATAASVLLVQRAGWLRSRADALGEDVASIHQQVRSYHLDQRAAVKSRRGVAGLLTELAVERGMAWADIARLIGVSVAAIRKWRGSSSASADHRFELAKLTAFLDLLDEYAIEDPAQWMEMRLPLPAGYVITPMDLYRRGEVTPLLEYASQRLDAARMLDEIDPRWRDSRSDFESYDAPDGTKAIRARKISE